MTFSRRGIYIGLIFAILFIGVSAVPLVQYSLTDDTASTHDKGLVPCGRTDQDDGNKTTIGTNEICQFCHLFVLIQNLLNFTFWNIAAPIAALMLLVGGFYMIIPTTKPANFIKGKQIIGSTIIGIFIVFFAWIGVDTAMKMLTYNEQDTTNFGPWNAVCEPMQLSTTPPVGPPGPDPTPSNYRCNEQEIILSSALISRTAGAIESCGSVGSTKTLASISRGEAPPVCFNGCNEFSICEPIDNVHLSLDMLNSLTNIRGSLGSNFRITSLTTGSHSVGSSHYSGESVDIQTTDIFPTYADLENALRNASPSATFVQCERGGEAVSCNGSSGAPDHIHARFAPFNGTLVECSTLIPTP